MVERVDTAGIHVGEVRIAVAQGQVGSNPTTLHVRFESLPEIMVEIA